MHTLGIKVRAGEKTVNKRFSKIAKYEKDKKKYVSEDCVRFEENI